MPRPLFKFEDFAVYGTATDDDLSFEEIGDEVDGDTFYQEMPWGQVELLRDALTAWLDNG